MIGCLRMNQLLPPFDNPAIRQVLLKVVDQTDFMQAVTGDDPKLRHVPAGFFCPGLPMASEAGLDVLTSKRDFDAAKKALTAAGYKGEKVVLMGASDFPSLKALSDVAADMLTRAGFNVDYQVMDWGSVVQRRAKRDPIAQAAGASSAPSGRARPGQPGGQRLPARDRHERPGRLADQREARDAAPGMARRSRHRRAQDARGRPAEAGLRGRALPAARAVFQPDLVQALGDRVLDGVPVFWNVRKG